MDRIFALLRTTVLNMTSAGKHRFFLWLYIALIPLSALLTLVLIPANIAADITTFFAVVLGMMAVGEVMIAKLGLPQMRLNAFEHSATIKTAVMAATVAMTGRLFWWAFGNGPPPFSFVIFGMTLTLITLMTRIVLRHILLIAYSRGQDRKRALIYGAGQTGTQLALALQTDKQVEPVAFLDDNSTLQRLVVAGLPVYSPINIRQLVDELRIDRVILAMPSSPRPKQAQILRRLRDLPCEVRIMPSFASLLGEGDLAKRIQPIDAEVLLNREGRVFDRRQIDAAYGAKTVLISGAGGSIGSELCRQLLNSAPSRLVLLDVSEAALYQIDRELKDVFRERIKAGKLTIRPVIGSVLDQPSVARILAEEQPHTVFHAAAYKHVPLVEQNMAAALANNFLGTRILAEEARKAGVARFVLVSTDKAVRPTNVMGATKRLAELAVQDLAARSETTRFSIVRFGNVLGSSGSVIPLFEDQIAHGGPVTVTHPDITRYFMTVSEAAHLVLLAGSYAEGGEVYVLDMGKPVPIVKLARQLIQNRGYTVKDAANPEGDIELSFTGLRPGEKLHEELLIGADVVATEHEKILRAREESLSELEFAAALRAARVAIETGSGPDIRNMLRRWVAGFDDKRPQPDLPRDIEALPSA